MLSFVHILQDKQTSTTARAANHDEADFSYDAFMQYLQGVGGNKSITSKSIVSDVEKYLTNCSHGSSTKSATDLLLDKKVLQAHYDKSKDIYQPTTITEKLRRLKMAIEFLNHTHDNEEVYMKATRTMEMLSRWIKALSKAIGKQRQQHGIKVRSQLENDEPTKAASVFLSNAHLQAKVNCAVLNLAASFNANDVRLLTAYAASMILYENSQRSGMIENLTVEEFLARVHKVYKEKERVIIPCVNHKTGPQGVAQLVTSLEGEELLLQYYTLARKKITPKPGCHGLFFLTPNGSRYTQVYRKICESIKASSINDIEPPKPETYRIGMSSKVARHLNDEKRRAVVKHMSHSEQTSEKYYEFVNFDDAAMAFDEINKLL